MLAIARADISANAPVLFGIVSGGPVRSVPAENVGCACSPSPLGLSRHVTVSSQQSQQQPFTLLSSPSDVNSHPSQSASSQRSVPVYPPNLPIWNVRPRTNTNTTTNPIHPASVLQPSESYCKKPFLRQLPGSFPTPTPRISLPPCFSESGIPQDLTPIIVTRSPSRDSCVVSPRGIGASSMHPGT